MADSSLPRFKKSILAIDVFFLLFLYVAILHLNQKAGLPDGSRSARISLINGVFLKSSQEVEFFLSSNRIGDTVSVAFPYRGTSRVALVPYNSRFFVASDIALLIVFFGLGFLVYLFRLGDRSALIFHVTSTCVAATLAGYKTLYSVSPAWLGYSCCIAFFLAYALIPVIFLHFTLVFPSVRRQARRIGWLYLAACIPAAVQSFLYLDAAIHHSVEGFRMSEKADMVQNGLAFLLLSLGIGIVIYSSTRAATASERMKLRWVLWGLSAGPAPYILFWVLPKAFGYEPWISELGFKYFLLLVPASFTASIVKHRIMDIDLMLNRSAVYTIVLVLLVIPYVGIAVATANLLSSWTVQSSIAVSTVTGALVALAFNPLRNRVQKFVDTSLLRIPPDLPHVQENFIKDVRDAADLRHLADVLLSHTTSLLDLERIGIFTTHQPGNRLKVLAHRNFDLLETRGLRLETEKLKTTLTLPVALPDLIEPGVPFEVADEGMFRRWGIAAVFTMQSKEKGFLGFLALGAKKGGARFAAEDISLMNAVTAQAALSLERIQLQQTLLLEQAETQRLEELNQMKSYFVSSVSHDLKTPLTSIKMFAELLRTKKSLSGKEAREYLSIIEGETERLTRLINNVLDFAKVEKGVQEYHFQNIELNGLVRKVVSSMSYQIKMEKCSFDLQISPEDFHLRADPDAITEALVNLLSNALKYSSGSKHVAVRTFRLDGFAAVGVQDNGIGVAPEQRARLFDPFYRTPQGAAHGAGGAGLGLAVVKHVVDAHSGSIEVADAPGGGSIFTMKLPFPPS